MAVRPRKGSAAVCSRCHLPAPGYDQLAERRFEFIPLWGSMPPLRLVGSLWSLTTTGPVLALLVVFALGMVIFRRSQEREFRRAIEELTQIGRE